MEGHPYASSITRRCHGCPALTYAQPQHLFNGRVPDSASREYLWHINQMSNFQLLSGLARESVSHGSFHMIELRIASGVHCDIMICLTLCTCSRLPVAVSWNIPVAIFHCHVSDVALGRNLRHFKHLGSSQDAVQTKSLSRVEFSWTVRVSAPVHCGSRVRIVHRRFAYHPPARLMRLTQNPLSILLCPCVCLGPGQSRTGYTVAQILNIF